VEKRRGEGKVIKNLGKKGDKKFLKI